MPENTVLVGADPECFVQKLTHNVRGGRIWEPVPAYGLFGGDKEKPIAMADMAEGYFYLEDNAALEFNIPPQKDADSFVNAISNARIWLRSSLLTNAEMEFNHENVMDLSAKYQKDPRGLRVGCMPDHDAYLDNGSERVPFTADSLGTKRYAGGHIHLSYNVDMVPAYVAARFLDLYLSLPWLEYDRQKDRRATYGKAGLFRPKKYGVEYRTPSNWWVWQPGRVQQQFIDGALYFSRRSYDPEYLSLLSEAYAKFPWPDLQRIIVTEDYGSAPLLMDLANRRYGLNVSGDKRRL